RTTNQRMTRFLSENEASSPATAPPNVLVHLLRRLVTLQTLISLDAAAVRCNFWFGLRTLTQFLVRFGGWSIAHAPRSLPLGRQEPAADQPRDGISCGSPSTTRSAGGSLQVGLENIR